MPDTQRAWNSEGAAAQHETIQPCGVLQKGPRTNLWVPNKCQVVTNDAIVWVRSAVGTIAAF